MIAVRNKDFAYRESADALSQVSVTANTLSKVLAYGCLYKISGEHVNTIGADSITISLVREGKPEKLLRQLPKMGYTVNPARKAPGIYKITGFPFPVQVIVTEELKKEDYLWLTSLTRKLSEEQAETLFQTRQSTREQGKRENMDSVLNVISNANKKTFEQLFGEERSMLRGGLYEIFKPEIDKAAKEAAEEAAREAALAAEKAAAKKLEAAETRNREDRRIILEKLESGDVEGALAFLRQ